MPGKPGRFLQVIKEAVPLLVGTPLSRVRVWNSRHHVSLHHACHSQRSTLDSYTIITFTICNPVHHQNAWFLYEARGDRQTRLWIPLSSSLI